MVLLALPAYALPWPICPKITVGLILGAFLIGFIDAEIHRKDNQ
jgi:hypothetical protein